MYKKLLLPCTLSASFLNAIERFIPEEPMRPPLIYGLEYAHRYDMDEVRGQNATQVTSSLTSIQHEANDFYEKYSTTLSNGDTLKAKRCLQGQNKDQITCLRSRTIVDDRGISKKFIEKCQDFEFYELKYLYALQQQRDK